MFNFKILFLTSLVAAAVFIGQAAFVHAEETRTLFGGPNSASVSFERDEIEVQSASGERYYFNVELATTKSQQAQGLMFRKELKTNHGMLFIFDDTVKRAFWMKNTLIPLDMLFVADNGEIHHIHHNATPQDLTSITSLHPSKAVLELKGGSSDILGIKEGDMIIHPAFRNVDVQK
jgi:uncharacterized membrane protein (UPF0127 family)